MASIPLDWRTNLRTNLVLWPEVSPNIQALAKQDGEAYVEDVLVAAFAGTIDTRVVRNTIEVMSLSGLALKEGDSPERLRLTTLGTCLFSFLGVTGDRKYASHGNRQLLAETMSRALAVVVEYRAVWQLMRSLGDVLSQEELNRAMTRIRYLEDVPLVAEAVRESRRVGDPTVIGPRAYREEDYADAGARSDQRKAIHPIFLLAGGGGLFMSGSEEGYYRLEDWVVPILDRRLEEPTPQIHGTTNSADVRLMSDYSGAPQSVWMGA